MTTQVVLCMSLATKKESARFIEWIRHLVVEYGSQSAVSRETSLSPAYVGKLVRGETDGTVRERTIEAVASEVGLPRSFFASSKAAVSKYADFQASKAHDSLVGSNYLRTVELEGRRLTDFADETERLNHAKRVADMILLSPAVQAAEQVREADGEDELRRAASMLLATLTHSSTNFSGK